MLGFGIGMDYYGTTHHKAFPIEETKCYLVDARNVGKPGVLIGSAMSEAAHSLTLMYPKNGQIVRARAVPNSEGWVQLLSGSFTQTRHCGMTMMTEVPEPEGMGTRNIMWGPPLPPLPDDEASKTPSAVAATAIEPALPSRPPRAESEKATL